MSSWEIQPYKGVGELQFGVKRTLTHQLLGVKAETFVKTPSDIDEVDAYDNLGLHLYFDDDDRLEFIEAFPPCNVHFAGISLLNDDLHDIMKQLKILGISSEYDDGGYFCHKVGFALYAPDDVIEGVSIYRKGYYDD